MVAVASRSGQRKVEKRGCIETPDGQVNEAVGLILDAPWARLCPITIYHTLSEKPLTGDHFMAKERSAVEASNPNFLLVVERTLTALRHQRKSWAISWMRVRPNIAT